MGPRRVSHSTESTLCLPSFARRICFASNNPVTIPIISIFYTCNRLKYGLKLARIENKLQIHTSTLFSLNSCDDHLKIKLKTKILNKEVNSFVALLEKKKIRNCNFNNRMRPLVPQSISTIWQMISLLYNAYKYFLVASLKLLPL